jgi:TRAP-type transport system small permease protein
VPRPPLSRSQTPAAVLRLRYEREVCMTAKGILSRILEVIMVVILSTMVVLVFGNVVARYVFNSAITWAEEVARFLFVWLTFVGASFGLQKGMHLGMDMIVSRLRVRARNIVEIVNGVIILAFLGVWAVGGVHLIEANLSFMSPATGFSMGLVYMIGPLAAVLMSIETITRLAASLNTLRRK